MMRQSARRVLKPPKAGAGVRAHKIRKKPTGIAGFDQITDGGLPEGRLTAVIGAPGTGKSLFAMQNLLNRWRTASEPGLYITFEESVDHVRSNLSGLDWSFDTVPEDQLMLIDARLPVDTVRGGAFDLSGLLAGLTARKAETGACNVVFDGIDLLVSSLDDEFLERRELARIDEWVRAEGVSAVITVKAHDKSGRDQTRIDLIQYMTDCVVILEGKLFDFEPFADVAGGQIPRHGICRQCGADGHREIRHPSDFLRSFPAEVTRPIRSGFRPACRVSMRSSAGGSSAGAASLSRVPPAPPRPVWPRVWWWRDVRQAGKPRS